MKFKTVAFIFAFLACAAIGKAGIVDWYCADDGDEVITCPFANVSLSYNETEGEYEMTMDGTHNDWDYGHMVGWFETDEDPTIKITNSFENDTDLDWTDYHLNIYMDQSFTIVADSDFVTTPADWDPYSIITAVTGPGTYYDADGNPHSYMGSIDYYAGTTVAISDTLEFGYKINFTYKGTINYTQEMLPTPEPGTFVLLACGLLGLIVLRRRFA